MRRSYLLNLVTLATVLLFTAVTASAQTEQMRGSVQMVGANGQQTPVAGAMIDVYRTDMKADYHTKSDKKGEWVFAGRHLHCFRKRAGRIAHGQGRRQSSSRHPG